MPSNFTAQKSLAVLQPELSKQWHPVLNGDSTPETVFASSNKKAYWICPVGIDHVWEAVILSRTQGNSCPFCANRRVLANFNDLASNVDHAKLVSEWHPDNALLPTQVSVKSNKKVKWRCSNNPSHEWEAVIANRTVRNSGCSICKKERKGANPSRGFVSDNKLLASEWSPENLRTAQATGLMSGRRIKWICGVNDTHRWEAVVANRLGGYGCPYCAGKRIEKGVSDITSLPEYALIVAQWHPDNILLPEDVSPGSRQEIKWLCVNNPAHVWKTAMSARRVKDTSGCPFCYGRIACPGETDLASDPGSAKLVAEWHPDNKIKPTQVTVNSSLKVKWRCSVNLTHEWVANICARSRGNGCPHCWSAKIKSGPEKELFDILSALGYIAERNNRYLLDYYTELDLYIPSLKFAIEFNGVYWHSESGGKGKDYHLKKVTSCANAGITLFQVWEDDWKTRKEVVIRSLAHRLGLTKDLKKVLPDIPDYWTESIGARKTTVIEITYVVAAAFLNDHHIQGSKSGSHYLGLVDCKGRLRAALVLSKTGNEGEFRVDRYATAGVVAGGFSKLLAYVKLAIKPKRLVTFADMSISNGELYEKTGFVVDVVNKPDYSYFIHGVRVHKFNYLISRFKNHPDLRWEEGLTEMQLADLNGLVRVWDSGKIRYIKDVVS